MHIHEKVLMDRAALAANGPINIVAFGDSVTHGAFNFNEYDYENVYWNVLKKKIQKKYPYIPVNVINAGIGGYQASNSLERLQPHVLIHNPDLVIVCFGLNDVQNELDVYLSSLRSIFEQITAHGCDCIFMTPNMLCTYVDESVPPAFINLTKRLADIQNSGRMDTYMEQAKALAKEMGVTVCDCYAKWKQMSQTQDVTKLLANRINHPNQEMHALFANDLYDCIFQNGNNDKSTADDAMYNH